MAGIRQASDGSEDHNIYINNKKGSFGAIGGYVMECVILPLDRGTLYGMYTLQREGALDRVINLLWIGLLASHGIYARGVGLVQSVDGHMFRVEYQPGFVAVNMSVGDISIN